MGTVMSIADVGGVKLSDVLPAWMADPLEIDIDDGHPEVLHENLSEHLLPNAMFSAGVVHICNNLVSDMDGELQGWSEWLPGFTAIANLLHQDPSGNGWSPSASRNLLVLAQLTCLRLGCPSLQIGVGVWL